MLIDGRFLGGVLLQHYETLQTVVKDATAKKAKGGAKGGAKDKGKDTITASGSSGSQKGKGKGKEKDLDEVGDEAEAKPKKAARGRGRPGAGAPKRHKLVEVRFLLPNQVINGRPFVRVASHARNAGRLP